MLTIHNLKSMSELSLTRHWCQF